MSSLFTALAALPERVEVLRAQINAVYEAWNGTAAKRFVSSAEDNYAILCQVLSSLTETASNYHIGGKSQAGVHQWGVTADGAIQADSAQLDETLAVTGASTLSGAVSCGDTLTVTGVLDANSTGTNTIAGTVRLGDNLANYWQAVGAASSSDPSLSVAGSDTDIDADVRPKGAGKVFLGANLTRYVSAVGSSAGAPTLAAEGAAGADLDLNAGASGNVYARQANTRGRVMTIAGDLPSGTIMMFSAASGAAVAAPTGWTLYTTGINAGSALRVVTSGTVGSGGSTNFASAWGATNTGAGTAHSHSIGSHVHDIDEGAEYARSGTILNVIAADASGSQIETTTGGASGGSGYKLLLNRTQASSGTSGNESAHTHSVSAYAPYYWDGFFCSKSA